MANSYVSFPGDFINAPQCSICLELVLDNVGRSITKLHCGHLFHADCIGSEFNSKGIMICPNCRKTEEDGNWLLFVGPEYEDPDEQTNNNVTEAISDEEFDEELLPYQEESTYNPPTSNMRWIPYFQQQLPLRDSFPPSTIATMLVCQRSAATISSVPVGPIPANYEPPTPPYYEQARCALPSLELTLATGTSVTKEHPLTCSCSLCYF